MREYHAFGTLFVVLYLFDEERTRIEIFSGIVAAGVVAVIVEHMECDVFLREKIEQFGVKAA